MAAVASGNAGALGLSAPSSRITRFTIPGADPEWTSWKSYWGGKTETVAESDPIHAAEQRESAETALPPGRA